MRAITVRKDTVHEVQTMLNSRTQFEYFVAAARIAAMNCCIVDSRAQCAGYSIILLDSYAPVVKHTAAFVHCCANSSNSCALDSDTRVHWKRCNKQDSWLQMGLLQWHKLHSTSNTRFMR